MYRIEDLALKIFFIFHMKEIQGNGQYSVTLDNVEIV